MKSKTELSFFIKSRDRYLPKDLMRTMTGIAPREVTEVPSPSVPQEDNALPSFEKSEAEEDTAFELMQETAPFAVLKDNDCPFQNKQSYFLLSSRDKLVSQWQSLSSPEERAILFREQRSKYFQLGKDYQSSFNELMKSAEQTKRIETSKVDSFIKQTKELLTYWEIIYFHLLTVKSLHWETNVKCAVTSLSDIFHVFGSVVSSTAKEDGKIWEKIFFVYSGLRNSQFINKVIEVSTRLKDSPHFNLFSTSGFLQTLLLSYLRKQENSDPCQEISRTYVKQLVGEIVQTTLDFNAKRKQLGLEVVHYQTFILFVAMHYKMMQATIADDQSLYERHLEKYCYYLELALDNVLKQREFSYIVRESSVSTGGIVLKKIPEGIAQTNEGNARLSEASALYLPLVDSVRKLKESTKTTTVDLTKMQKKLEALQVKIQILTLELEKEKTSYLVTKKTPVVTTEPQKKEHKDKAKKRVKQDQEIPLTLPSSPKGNPPAVKTEADKVPVPSIPFASISSTTTSTSTTTTTTTPTLRIPEEEQKAAKREKIMHYFSKHGYFQHPKSALPLEEEVIEECVFEFPIVGGGIHARLSLSACEKQIDKTELKEILPKLTHILERTRATGKQGQGIKFVDATEKALLGYPPDALVFKIKPLGKLGDRVRVYGQLVEHDLRSEVVFDHVVLGDVHKQAKHQSGRSKRVDYDLSSSSLGMR